MYTKHKREKYVLWRHDQRGLSYDFVDYTRSSNRSNFLFIYILPILHYVLVSNKLFCVKTNIILKFHYSSLLICIEHKFWEHYSRTRCGLFPTSKSKLIRNLILHQRITNNIYNKVHIYTHTALFTTHTLQCPELGMFGINL